MEPYEKFKEELGTRHYLLWDTCTHPEKLKILLVASEEDKRRQACDYLKEVLIEKIEEDKLEAGIQKYEVRVIDLKEVPSPIWCCPSPMPEMYELWERSGNKEGELFIPIFHNADQHRNLPQVAFDHVKPGICSYTPEGWINIHNQSKRQCFRRFNV